MNEILVSCLHSVAQFHIWHITAKSIKVHNILDEYYHELQDKVDEALESFITNGGVFDDDYEVTYQFVYDIDDVIEGIQDMIDTSTEVISENQDSPELASFVEVFTQIQKISMDIMYKIEMKA